LSNPVKRQTHSQAIMAEVKIFTFAEVYVHWYLRRTVVVLFGVASPRILNKLSAGVVTCDRTVNFRIIL